MKRIFSTKSVLIMQLCMFLFLHCSESLTGGSTETVNAKVSASVFLPDSTAAFGAFVKMFPSGQSPLTENMAVFSNTTDKFGLFTIKLDSLTGRYFNLLISLNGMAYFSDSLLIGSGPTTLSPMILSTPGSLSGSVVFEYGDAPDSGYALLIGTDFSSPFQSGNFSFPNLPEGRYTIRLIAFQRGYAPYDSTIFITSGISDTLSDPVIIPSVNLLVDDFDDGDEFLIYNRTDINDGWNSFWYAFDEKDNGNLSQIFPEGITNQSHFSRALTEEGSYSGKSFHMRAILSDRDNPFAGMGCRISTDRHSVADLSTLKAFSFYLKGKGRIRVSFTAKALNNYPENQRWGTWGTYIDCTDDWEKFVIDASELIPQENSPQQRDNLTWDAVNDSVENLQFVTSGAAGDTIEFYLDNIYFIGVELQDLE